MEAEKITAWFESVMKENVWSGEKVKPASIGSLACGAEALAPGPRRTQRDSVSADPHRPDVETRSEGGGLGSPADGV